MFVFDNLYDYLQENAAANSHTAQYEEAKQIANEDGVSTGGTPRLEGRLAVLDYTDLECT